MTNIPVAICRCFENNLKAFISKRNGCFSISDCISEMCMKFRTFWKERRVSYPNCYWNYCIRKRCLLKRLKGLSSAHHSVINVLTGSKHCWSQHGTTTFLLFYEIEKMSALVTSEIFRLFVNTLTTDEKYSRRYIQIFWQQLQTPLSQKGKPFSPFLIAFLKCAWNFEYSEKKEEYRSVNITEIIASERFVYLSV